MVGDSAAILYHNNGDGTFTDVTATSRTTNAFRALAADWGDYDNDGDLDLYVVNYVRPHRLLRNNGDGTFTDVATGAVWQWIISGTAATGRLSTTTTTDFLIYLFVTARVLMLALISSLRIMATSTTG